MKWPLLVSFFCMIVFPAAAQHTFFNSLEDTLYAAPWINVSTRISGNAFSGNHFSRTDASNQYGLGIEMDIPEDLKRKNFYIRMEGRIRSGDSLSNTLLVTTLTVGDSAIFWYGAKTDSGRSGINQWSAFSDSTLLPGNIPASSRVKIYLWNRDGKSTADLDDLKITLVPAELPSHLPK